MKSDVHPEYNPVVFKDGEHEIVTRSTATSENTREIDGVEHYVIKVDISAFTHPFYTGQKKLVDTEGRVDRFKKRYNIQDDDGDDEAEAQESDDEVEAQESDDEASSEPDSSDTDGQEAAGEEETEEATEETEDDSDAQNEAEDEDEDEDEENT